VLKDKSKEFENSDTKRFESAGKAVGSVELSFLAVGAPFAMYLYLSVSPSAWLTICIVRDIFHLANSSTKYSISLEKTYPLVRTQALLCPNYSSCHPVKLEYNQRAFNLPVAYVSLLWLLVRAYPQNGSDTPCRFGVVLRAGSF
jgi:hypothetical protein